MLNRVDLPQPDGPITARNSPGATVKDMRSIATSGPSGVSKRLETSSTMRMGSAAAAAGSMRAGEAAVTMCDPIAARRARCAPSPPSLWGGGGWGGGVLSASAESVEAPLTPTLSPQERGEGAQPACSGAQAECALRIIASYPHVFRVIAAATLGP